MNTRIAELIPQGHVADPAVESCNRRSVEQPDQPRCVVIASSARGGSSWVLKVLDSHPKTWGCHEPFVQIQDQEFLQLVQSIKSGNPPADAGRRLIQQFVRPRVGTHKPPLLRKDFLATPPWLRTWMWMGARVASPLEGIYRFASTARLNSEHVVLVKNRPFPHLPSLLETTGAQVLCLVRHPCAVVSSWWKGIQMGAMADAPVQCDRIWNLLNATRPDAFGMDRAELDGLSPYSRLAWNWLCDYKLMMDIVASDIPSRLVVYSDLVNNPEEEWRGVFSWMNLSFDPATRRFLNQSGQSQFDIRQFFGKRSKYFSTMRHEASPTDAWKKKLSPEQIEEILSVIRPHYDLSHHWPSDA